MYKIALIGVGQIGIRHLQGLSLSKSPISIEVVDVNSKSLDAAREALKEVPEFNFEIKYFTDVSYLSYELDVVIIATASVNRGIIIENLLTKSMVKNLIIEKFMFANLNDYNDVELLLAEKGLLNNTWVNCPRRLFSGYKKLKIEMQGLNFHYSIVGFNWGLACNSIHFLDLVQMLGSSSICDIKFDCLEQKIFPSKRLGYIEFNGTITARTNNDCFISLSSFVGAEFKIVITIVDSHGDRWDIDEKNDMISKNGNFWSSISMKYQSMLTGLIVDSIISNNGCDLPKFSESKELHVRFLTESVNFYNKIMGRNGLFCPIT